MFTPHSIAHSTPRFGGLLIRQAGPSVGMGPRPHEVTITNTTSGLLPTQGAIYLNGNNLPDSEIIEDLSTSEAMQSDNVWRRRNQIAEELVGIIRNETPSLIEQQARDRMLQVADALEKSPQASVSITQADEGNPYDQVALTFRITV